MSTATQPGQSPQSSRTRHRNAESPRGRRVSDKHTARHVHAEHAARGRRERADSRALENRRINDLLRRGAGVSQILREIGRAQDRASDRLDRAKRLRLALEALGGARGQSGDVR